MRLILGDCIRELESIPNNSVDMVLSDLPYGTTKNRWDKVIQLDRLWEQLRRVCKENAAIVLFAQAPFDKTLALSNPKEFRYEWVWVKPQGTGHLNAKKMPLKRHELILVFYRKSPKYCPQFATGTPYVCRSGRGSANYDKQISVQTVNTGIRYPTSVLQFNSEKGFHPTQKPVLLCEYLIKTYSDEGDIVLDCCMGSGTTGVACLNLGRDFIGIEKEKSYFDIAKDRVLRGKTK